MRPDENCHLFWEDVKQKVTKLGVNATKLSRKKRAPTRIEQFFGGSAAPEYANDIISHDRGIYSETLYLIINATENQFDQEDFRRYVKLENVLFRAAKGDIFIQEYNDVMAVNGIDFSENRFQVQYLRNLKVKSHLSEVFKLTKLILVLPAINATSQRTFSLLKLIKNYIQSTMKQSRLKK